MIIDDNTYNDMSNISSQIEGITCALAVYIENAGYELEKYNYKPFNDFYNEIRQHEINAIRKINELFDVTSKSVTNILHIMKASEDCLMQMNDSLTDMKDIFSRLIIHCENIREIKSHVYNPEIPDAEHELYNIFNDYKKITDQYSVSISFNDEDMISQIMHTFYDNAMNIFSDLNEQYDMSFKEVGSCLENRQSQIKAISENTGLPQKRENPNIYNILGYAIQVGLNTGLLAKSISIKDTSENIENGVSLVGSIGELISKSIEASPKKSRGHEILKGACNVADNISSSYEMVDESFNALGIEISPEFKILSVETILFIFYYINRKKNNLKSLKEKNYFENFAHAAGLLSDVTAMIKYATNPVRTIKNPLGILKRLISASDHSINLIDNLRGIIHSEDAPKTPSKVVSALRKLDKQAKEYKTQVEEFKFNKSKGYPAKKPQRPKWVLTYSIVDKIGSIITSEKAKNFIENLNITAENMKIFNELLDYKIVDKIADIADNKENILKHSFSHAGHFIDKFQELIKI